MTWAIMAVCVVFAVFVALCGLALVGVVSKILTQFTSLVDLCRRNVDEMSLQRDARSVLEVKAAHEAAEYLRLQKTAVESHTKMVELAAQRLEAEIQHIATCEERYRASLAEATDLDLLSEKPRKVKAH